MKIIALIATSLALLGANALAHDAATSARTVKVTNGSVITLYSIPSDELTAKGGYTAATSKSVTYNDKTGEASFEEGVTIRLGASLVIYADKATLNTKGETPFILIQSDGKIESNEGEHKVTQFASEGTRIELPK